MKQPEVLIDILLDQRASEAERDDAAMDLGAYDNDLALNALVKTALDSNVPYIIAASCGESIGRIFVKRNKFYIEIYKQLPFISKDEFDSYILCQRPEWSDYLIS